MSYTVIKGIPFLFISPFCRKTLFILRSHKTWNKTSPDSPGIWSACVFEPKWSKRSQSSSSVLTPKKIAFLFCREQDYFSTPRRVQNMLHPSMFHEKLHHTCWGYEHQCKTNHRFNAIMLVYRKQHNLAKTSNELIPLHAFQSSLCLLSLPAVPWKTSMI